MAKGEPRLADSGITELYKAHRSGQDKYTYFLLAAAGAAIAFSLNQTHDATLSWPKLPLGAAVLCWGLSFFFGCLALHDVQNLLQQNYQFLRMRAGEHPDFPAHPQVVEEISKTIEEQAKNSGRNPTRQFNFLIVGAVLYIVWHILEMYLRTNMVALPFV